eukprot:15288950-Alexandrium_andersonii.AAC.1
MKGHSAGGPARELGRERSRACGALWVDLGEQTAGCAYLTPRSLFASAVGTGMRSPSAPVE